MHIVADENIPLLRGIFEPYCQVDYCNNKKITNTFLKRKKTTILLVRTRNKVNSSLLDGTKVEFVGSATTGIDHLDINYFNKRKIFWMNCPNCNSNSVVHYICAVLNYYFSHYNIKYPNKLVFGIIGYGNIGSKIVPILESLGINIIINDPPLEKKKKYKIVFSSLNEVLKKSDILSIHVPYTLKKPFKTHYLMTNTELNKMKKNALLINTSRGPIISNSDLLKHKKNFPLFNYVLDVWENEPNINLELLEKSFLATPHIAGYSIDGKANATKKLVQKISHFYKLPFNSSLLKKVPEQRDFSLKINSKSKILQVFKKILAETYNIKEENDKFKNSPHLFEIFRKNYPIRKDLTNYFIGKLSINEKVNELLKSMNIKVKSYSA